MSDFKTEIDAKLSDMGTTAENAAAKQLYEAVSKAAMKKACSRVERKARSENSVLFLCGIFNRKNDLQQPFEFRSA